MKDATKEPVIIPLSGKSNVEVVFEQLERLIGEEFWKAEEKLPSEFELCRKFNVGRSTIREALNILKARELVFTIPGLGTFVNKREESNRVLAFYTPNPKSEKDLLNIMELRLGLEPMSAALAARRITKTQLRNMEKHHLKHLASVDPALFAENDIIFHQLLANASGNPLIENAIAIVHTFLQQQQFLTSQEESRRHKAGKFHAQLLDALHEHNEFAAEDIMREHMDDTYIYIKSIINQSHPHSGRWHRRRDHPKIEPGLKKNKG